MNHVEMVLLQELQLREVRNPFHGDQMMIWLFYRREFLEEGKKN